MVQADMYRKLADSREDEIMHLQSKLKKMLRISLHNIHLSVYSGLKIGPLFLNSIQSSFLKSRKIAKVVSDKNFR